MNPCEVFVETKAGKHQWKSVTLSLSHCPSQLLFPVHLCYFVSPTESQKHLLPGMPQALLSRIQSNQRSIYPPNKNKTRYLYHDAPQIAYLYIPIFENKIKNTNSQNNMLSLEATRTSNLSESEVIDLKRSIINKFKTLKRI